MDDNGRMVQHSYTKGARGEYPITAAVNIEKHYDLEGISQHQHDHVSIQSLLWNLARKKMPRSITKAFESAMAGRPRSNWNTKRVDSEAISNISIKAGDIDLEFTTGPGGLELGPPSGVCASQYSKDVSLVELRYVLTHFNPQRMPLRREPPSLQLRSLHHHRTQRRPRPLRFVLLGRLRHQDGELYQHIYRPSLRHASRDHASRRGTRV